MSSLGKRWTKTPEQIKNNSDALKGRKAWNKGKKRPKFSKKWRENMAKAHKGLKRSFETRKKMSISAKGRVFTKEHKRRIGLAHSGEKSRFWEGGKSFEPYTIDWTRTLRQSIRERDNNTCQICGKPQAQENRLFCVHHIDYNKRNCDPKNLITLCRICHNKTNVNRKYWIKFFNKL